MSISELEPYISRQNSAVYKRGGLEWLDAPLPSHVREISTKTADQLENALHQSGGEALVVVHMGMNYFEYTSDSSPDPKNYYHVPTILKDRYASYFPLGKDIIRQAHQANVPIILLVTHFNDQLAKKYSKNTSCQAVNHFLFLHHQVFPEITSLPFFFTATKHGDPEPLDGYKKMLGLPKQDINGLTGLEALAYFLKRSGATNLTVMGELLGGTNHAMQNRFVAINSMQYDAVPQTPLDRIRFGGCVGVTVEAIRSTGISVAISPATFPFQTPTPEQLILSEDGTYHIQGEPEWVRPLRSPWEHI